MKKLIPLILLLFFSLLDAREINIRALQYQNMIEDQLRKFIEKHIKADEYILSLDIKFNEITVGGNNGKRSNTNRRSIKKMNDTVLFIPFQNDKHFLNDDIEKEQKSQIIQTGTRTKVVINSIKVNLELSRRIKKKTILFIAKTIRSHLKLGKRDKLTLKRFSQLSEKQKYTDYKKLKEERDKLTGLNKNAEADTAAKKLFVLKEWLLDNATSLSILVLGIIVLGFGLMFFLSFLRLGKTIKQGMSILAGSIGDASSAAPPMITLPEQLEDKSSRGNIEALPAPGANQDMEKVKAEFIKSVNQYPFLWSKHLYDLTYQPQGVNIISEILSFAGATFMDKMMHVIPGDAKRQMNKAIIEGELTEVHVDAMKTVTTIMGRVASEAIMYPRDFPFEKASEFSAFHNKELDAFFEALDEENRVGILMVVLLFSHRRISDLLEEVNAEFKAELTKCVVNKSGISLNDAVEYIEHLHPYIRSLKEQLTESGVMDEEPEYDVAKYLGGILNNVSEETSQMIINNVESDVLKKEINKHHISIATLLHLHDEDYSLLLQHLPFSDLSVLTYFCPKPLKARIFNVLTDKRKETVLELSEKYDTDKREMRKAEKSYNKIYGHMLRELKRLMDLGEIEIEEPAITQVVEKNVA